MKFRAELKVNGVSLNPRALQVFGQDIATCRKWATEVLSHVAEEGATVEIYETRENLVDCIEPPKKVEAPKE